MTKEEEEKESSLCTTASVVVVGWRNEAIMGMKISIEIFYSYSSDFLPAIRIRPSVLSL